MPAVMAQKRSEAPVAIALITNKRWTMPATRLDQVLNKVSGVNMVNLGNEQHEMSIRRPMTTKAFSCTWKMASPSAPQDCYNPDTLLEMNMTAARQIEVIKGPALHPYTERNCCGAVNIS